MSPRDSHESDLGQLEQTLYTNNKLAGVDAEGDAEALRLPSSHGCPKCTATPGGDCPRRNPGSPLSGSRPSGEGGDAHAGSAEVARRPAAAAGEQPDSSRRVAPGRAPEATGLAFVTPRAAWHTEKASRSTRDPRRRVPEGWTPGAGAPPAARRSLTCALPKLLPDDQASRTNRRRGLAVTLPRAGRHLRPVSPRAARPPSAPAVGRAPAPPAATGRAEKADAARHHLHGKRRFKGTQSRSAAARGRRGWEGETDFQL